MIKITRIARQTLLVGLMLILALPILAVLSALVSGETDSWLRLLRTTLPEYLINTLALMTLVSILAGSIGVLTAWFITAFDFPGRRVLSWMLILPLAAPAYIVAYLYTDLMEYYGPAQTVLRSLFGWQSADEYWFPNIRNIPGAALMLGLVLYPYVYLLARSSFQHQSYSQWYAARSLGQSPGRAFFHIILPSARPAIAGGLALVLMETLADFGVADYFAIPTLSTGIFRSWLALGDKAVAMKLASIMLLVVFTLVLFESFSRRGAVTSTGKMIGRAKRMTLSRSRSIAVMLACALPVLFGFFIPFFTLGYYALTVGDPQGMGQFLSYILNSVYIALMVSIAAVILAVLFAYLQRYDRSFMSKATIRLSTLGYALPGALLAVGLLTPLGLIDQSLTRFASERFGSTQGLILTGTTIALFYALVIRFLTVSFNSVTSGFDKIPMSIDHATRSLGATPFKLIQKIHIPLLSPSIAVGAILVIIDTIRELPATLILRPFNFETLATRVYWLASDERLREASSAAILIIVIGAIPVLILNSYAASPRNQEE